MRKVIIISLFLFSILFSPNASGFEDTVERYPTGAYTDYWTYSSSYDKSPYATHSLAKGVTSHPFVSNNNVLYMQSTVGWYNYINPKCFTYQSLTSKYNIDDSYFSFIVVDNSSIPDRTPYNLSYHNDLVVTYLRPTDDYVLCDVRIIMSPGHKYEIIKSGDNKVSLYDNGVKKSDINYNTAYTDGVVKPKITYEWGSDDVDATTTGYVYIDDISTSSCIGIPTLTNEGVNDFSFTWSSQLMRSYSDQHKISLYSLSNPNNAGLIKTWDLENSPEFGEISDDRGDVLGSNFGLYMLEMSRGSDILTDQYFYYDQLSNPNGFPELLFLGESSVKTEIRDDNYNGGEIAGGGSVYLYPKIKEDAAYNFTYNILEAPYKIQTELTTVYNNTPINSTTIYYTGLSNQNYIISVDGADTGSTNGADTFSHTFTDWGTEKNHTISFAPDYSIAGVWGEVKNSETQQGIKSATVSVSDENFSKTLYTDDNGLFYLTTGMEPGKTYTITVSKTGYTTPPSQTTITVDGSTTRQDFYMDKIPGVDGEGIYYSPHNVRFVVTDRYLFERYDANVTISGENVTTETQRTGTDGVCVFKMTENTRYEIVTEYNGMKQTDYISPIEYSYYIILDATGTSLLPTSQFYETCSITITKNEVNSSHATITTTYSDTGTGTNSVYFVLGQTYENNNTLNVMETSNVGTGNMTYTFTVQDYVGEDYVIKVVVNHDSFGDVEKYYGINFPGSALPFKGNMIIALVVLVFFVVAMQWGKADAHMGAVLICGLGWWFYYLDIFEKLGSATNTVIGVGLGLATVYAVLSMINKKRDEGGI